MNIGDNSALEKRLDALEIQIEKVNDVLKHIEVQQSQIIAKQDQLSVSNRLKNRIQWEEIKKVYALLQDRESELLFWARVHYSVNWDFTMLYKYLIEAERKGNPDDIISLFKSRRQGDTDDELIMYGTTPDAKEIYGAISSLGIKVDYICIEQDVKAYTRIRTTSLRDCWGKTPLITEKEMIEKHRNAKIFIGCTLCEKAKQHLIDIGFGERQVYRRNTQWEVQYLDSEIMIPREHEVFVDGGAYDMQNTREFIDWCGSKYDEVYAFEPDEDNYQKCLETVQEINKDNIHVYNAALSATSGTLSFNNGYEDASHLDSNGVTTVKAESIDDILNGKPVTYIKLDIEGGELDALKGARNSIKKYKPRLAICIYHKANDITEIPLYIHSLVPEYKMYIRHYSTCRSETVLYCVI